MSWSFQIAIEMLCPYWDSEIKKWRFHCSNLNFITDFPQSLQIYPNLVICLDNPLIAYNFLNQNHGPSVLQLMDSYVRDELFVK